MRNIEILAKYPKLVNTPIESLTLRRVIVPWKDWEKEPNYNSPSWWKDYQKVKHYRHSNFNLALLEKFNCENRSNYDIMRLY